MRYDGVVLSNFHTYESSRSPCFASREGQEKFQITLPAELREVLHLAVGDLLEATIQDNVIVLKPKDVVDRAHARQQLIEVMDRVHAKLPPSIQDPKEEEEEIAREIKAYPMFKGGWPLTGILASARLKARRWRSPPL